MLKLDINGTIHEVQGIDVNVFGPPYTDGHVHIAVYETTENEETGFWDTDTGSTLVSMETNLDPAEWEDDWFAYSGTTPLSDFPAEVFRFIRPLLVKEV